MFTTDNWNFALYKNGRMQASLNLIGSPHEDEVLIKYGLTLTDQDNKEYFNHDFDKLEDAIKEINIRYAHWDFSLSEEAAEADGCSSCQAH